MAEHGRLLQQADSTAVMVEDCRHRLRLEQKEYGHERDPNAAQSSEDVLCTTLRPVIDRCLDPAVFRGGGMSHTHANGYRDSCPMGCRVATSYEAGWLVCQVGSG